jgi:hypothetical protein
MAALRLTASPEEHERSAVRASTDFRHFGLKSCSDTGCRGEGLHEASAKCDLVVVRAQRQLRQHSGGFHKGLYPSHAWWVDPCEVDVFSMGEQLATTA